ncbi:MAG: Methyltransferase domain protein [Candidatus Gottesmanbacteria bacterium GW2011_GWC2_39_8]|uniref:Methyltransferase domain protein n=1 Tax=Candidatus Gottesmanbacteria bacterium GW2011_GWC2_39_8 TaxID=1618450 RepID=A0A0G0Q1W5_9BACT|nr:MAG: Methyltransferase domain protein [Candidatus Gottesmanbacteria bacterium GW2011_GWC2_39_8]
MSLLSYFYPQIVEEVDSEINGKITVVEQFGKKYISVGGLTQSGGLLKNVWEKGIREASKLQPFDFTQGKRHKASKILILGLGGGTLVKIINHYYSEAHITGVDIDPKMVEMGRKHLGLDKAKNLKVVIADAAKFIKNNKGKYDLILVDLYIGSNFPAIVLSESFISNLRDAVKEKGIMIVNYLYYKKSKEKAGVFIEMIKKVFTEVTTIKPLVNMLIICRKS